MTHLAEPRVDVRSQVASQLITWRDGVATFSRGAVEVEDLAKAYGTPLYVYDADVIERQYSQLRATLPASIDIYYSIKANPHPSVVAVLLAMGAGCEIASGGEYAVARRSGALPERIIFAGPGKGRDELDFVLARGVQEIHVESFDEIELLEEITARLQTTVAVSIRVNPSSASSSGLMMGGQPTAFGFEEEALPDAVRALAGCARIEVRGLHVYSGTQILDAKSILTNWKHAIELAKQMAEITRQPIKTVDLGGGLGVPYFAHERSLDLDALREGAKELFASAGSGARLAQAQFIVEPGRFLVASAGVYLARVRSIKSCRGAIFVVLDGGMNHHLAASGNLGQVVRRDYPIANLSRRQSEPEVTVAVVGPLCTPIDTLGRQIRMPRPRVGDLLGIMQSGAYGLTASPTSFLSHPTPAEILIRGETVERITPRGSTF
jgi:diaminopimelate decarboxylase